MLTRLLQTELVSLTAALSVTLNGIALVYHWTPETVGVINGILAAWLLVVRQAVTPNVTADANTAAAVRLATK